jgi:hypothetical protein
VDTAPRPVDRLAGGDAAIGPDQSGRSLTEDGFRRARLRDGDRQAG